MSLEGAVQAELEQALTAQLKARLRAAIGETHAADLDADEHVERVLSLLRRRGVIEERLRELEEASSG